jgi:hypothetical protein
MTSISDADRREYAEQIAADHVRKGLYDDDDLQLLGITRDEAERAYREKSVRQVAEYALSLEAADRRALMRELGVQIASLPTSPGRWTEIHLTGGPCLKGWLFETAEDED